MKILKSIIVLSSFIISSTVFSDIYQCKDSNGNITFQGKPCAEEDEATTLKLSGSESFELPTLELQKVKTNETIKSSSPDLTIRQIEYLSSATPEELLEFYNTSPHIKSCSYNKAGDNQWCKLANHGKISSGSVVIPTKANNGIVVVFADYFFRN